MKTIYSVVLLVMLTLSAHASYLLTTENEYSWGFTLTEGNQYYAKTIGIIYGVGDRLDVGERLSISIFEDESDELPLREVLFSGSSFAVGAAYLDISSYDYFQDRDGYLVFKMVSGTVSIDRFSVVAGVNGIIYQAGVNPVAIPEPGAFAMAASMAAFLFAFTKKLTRKDFV